MKKAFIYLLFILIIANLKADEKYYFNKLSMDDFVAWMQSVKIPDFTLTKTETQGSSEMYNIEYAALFTNIKEEMLNPRIGHPDLFYGYEDLKNYERVGPYDLDGFPAVFIYHQRLTKPSNMTYLLVQMPVLNATFSITALTKERLTQEKMEEFFRYFKLKSVDNGNKIIWPDEVPIAIRLTGEITEITIGKSSDEFVKNEVSVKIAKSDEFLKQLKKFYKEKKGWLDLTTYDNITLICKTAQVMSTLEKMKDKDIIEFVYFIK
jgi:hypothetical protein